MIVSTIMTTGVEFFTSKEPGLSKTHIPESAKDLFLGMSNKRNPMFLIPDGTKFSFIFDGEIFDIVDRTIKGANNIDGSSTHIKRNGEIINKVKKMSVDKTDKRPGSLIWNGRDYIGRVIYLGTMHDAVQRARGPRRAQNPSA